MNVNTLMKQFRKDLQRDEDITLDFRTMRYVLNNVNLSPVFDDTLAENIVLYLYNWANTFIEAHAENYPHFGCFVFNLQMSVDTLRTTTLKMQIEDVLNELCVHYIDVYRIEDNKVYKYYPDQRAYVFDHQYRAAS